MLRRCLGEVWALHSLMLARMASCSATQVLLIRTTFQQCSRKDLFLILHNDTSKYLKYNHTGTKGPVALTQ